MVVGKCPLSTYSSRKTRDADNENQRCWRSKPIHSYLVLSGKWLQVGLVKHVFSLPIGCYMSWEDSINQPVGKGHGFVKINQNSRHDVVDRKVATIKTHSFYHIIPDPTDPTPNSVGNLMPSRHRMRKTYQKKQIPSSLNCWWTVFVQPPHRWSHLSPIWCWHFPFFGSSKHVVSLKLPKFIIILHIFLCWLISNIGHGPRGKWHVYPMPGWPMPPHNGLRCQPDSSMAQKQSRHGGRATAGSRKRMEGPRMDNDSTLDNDSTFGASWMYVHGQWWMPCDECMRKKINDQNRFLFLVHSTLRHDRIWRVFCPQKSADLVGRGAKPPKPSISRTRCVDLLSEPILFWFVG